MSRPPSRATEHVGYRTYGNSTLFGDAWSSAGTVVRESQLVRADSRLTLHGSATSVDLDPVLHRINHLRILNGVGELLKVDRLGVAAKEWARQIILDNQFRGREGTDMNVWMGSTLSERIADEWNEEMRSRGRNFLECAHLSKVGIASQWHQRAQSFIVVAAYE
ncbi:hypothetical protein L596_014920 [Steinernema carpocapsae]|uniref:SCP domain-containing protein n=1 Tax=Steinernema carpocapsae TaxID=34508 RepID=A0A4V6A2X9_STECR|nr:hypothetical protein L596_014920 [Steinernema carpocapsae]